MTPIEKAINKGFPIYESIRLSFDDLITIANDKSEALNDIRKIRIRFNKRLHELTTYLKMNYEMVDSINICASMNDSKTRAHIDMTNFFVKLQYILNVDNVCNDDSVVLCNDIYNEEARNKILERIKVLESYRQTAHKYNIKHQNEVENLTPGKLFIKEFPEIYNDYVLGLDQQKALSIAEDFSDDERQMSSNTFTRDRYFAYGLRFIFYYFLDEQVKMYTNFLNELDDLKKYCDSLDVTNFLNNIDPDKLSRLIAHRYITVSESQADKKIQKERAQKAIYYILGYLREANDKLNYMTLANGEKVSYFNILEGYRRLAKKRIHLYDTTREPFIGMTRDEANEQLQENLKSYQPQRRWVQIPVHEEILKGIGSSVDETHEQRVAKRYKLYDEKIDFYKNLEDVIELQDERDTENGEIIFVLPNGYIITDTFFNNMRTYDPAVEKGIFIYTIDNFEQYYGLTRKLRIYEPTIIHKYHSKHWLKNIKDILNKPATPESVKKTREFVQRITENNKEYFETTEHKLQLKK